MLWGIDPLLTADLLYALRRMGHGDEIVVVGADFSANSTAMSTVMGEPIRWPASMRRAQSKRSCR